MDNLQKKIVHRIPIVKSMQLIGKSWFYELGDWHIIHLWAWRKKKTFLAQTEKAPLVCTDKLLTRCFILAISLLFEQVKSSGHCSNNLDLKRKHLILLVFAILVRLKDSDFNCHDRFFFKYEYCLAHCCFFVSVFDFQSAAVA